MYFAQAHQRKTDKKIPLSITLLGLHGRVADNPQFTARMCLFQNASEKFFFFFLLFSRLL